MFGSNVRIALGSLRASRTRTTLTTLGITIGVASILLVFAAGAGARNEATANLGGIPASTALLASGNGASDQPSPFSQVALQGASVFTERDLGSLHDSGLVSSAAPILPIAGPVTSHGHTARTAFIDGTGPNLFGLLGTSFADGSPFGSDQGSVVLGHNVAESLFNTELASGKMVQIRGDEYTVTGVLASSQLPLEVTGTPIDDTVFIPYQQAKTYTAGYAQFSRVFAGINPALFGRVGSILSANHDGQTDFTISRASAIDARSPLLAVLVSVTAVTAGLSLVIGGIGIMNIMLVNVSERTREIGIRKAIGASSGVILVQFLIEAAVMSLAGGILGTIVGILAAVVAGLFLPFGLLFTPSAVATVLGVSLAVGILFGLFPAIRAARKDTIEALRYYQ